MPDVVLYDPTTPLNGAIAQAFIESASLARARGDVSWSSYLPKPRSWVPDPGSNAQTALFAWWQQVKQYGWTEPAVILTAALFQADQVGIRADFLQGLRDHTDKATADLAESLADQSYLGALRAYVDGKFADLDQREAELLTMVDKAGKTGQTLGVGAMILGFGILGAAVIWATSK